MNRQYLRNIADIQTGPFGSQLHKEDYVNDGTPIVTVEHLGNRVFTKQNLPKVSDEDKVRLAKYVLSKGDIVFSRVGSVDRCSYVDEVHDGWMFSGRCLRVRPTGVIDPLFLYYFFCLEKTKQFVRNIAVGATMPSINTKLLGEVEIVYPVLDVQRKIVKTLSAIDDKIENNQKINDNLQQQAMALFDSWFVSFNRTNGEVPADWTEGTLGDISTIISGKRPPMKQAVETDGVQIPLVGASSIMGFTNAVLYNEPILVTGRVGTHGVVQRFQTPCWTSDNTLVIKSSFYEFTYQVLQRVDYVNMNRGSTQPLITQTDLKNVSIVLPPKTVLLEFEELAGSLMAMYEANRKENNRLAVLRDSLLPKLMSGELDVSDIDL
ncbi:restriction endonuclease subunit S [Akkermansia muciniphila]|uniref:restriction endonuclease subunit S n=2 Tax=Akkermansia muciniphila TaxID=239935 RepID=UPI000FE175A3|nr:restriction endonuclease subunit S [Akkermansia muciniphila]QAA37353.1 restriction endonuclease subunit S [Akkermansia muciniphila]